MSAELIARDGKEVTDPKLRADILEFAQRMNDGEVPTTLLTVSTFNRMVAELTTLTTTVETLTAERDAEPTVAHCDRCEAELAFDTTAYCWKCEGALRAELATLRETLVRAVANGKEEHDQNDCSQCDKGAPCDVLAGNGALNFAITAIREAK